MKILGRVMAFKGDDLAHENDGVVIEITEVTRDGVEIAFDLPLRQRVYLRVPVGALVDAAIAEALPAASSGESS